MDPFIPAITPAQEFIVRESSAEEILEASINFQRVNSREYSTLYSALYPSVDQLQSTTETEVAASPTDSVLLVESTSIATLEMEEEQIFPVQEINNDSHVMSVASLDEQVDLTDVAVNAVAVYKCDDDFVMLNTVKETRLISQAKTEINSLTAGWQCNGEGATLAVAEASSLCGLDSPGDSIEADTMTEVCELQQDKKPSAVASNSGTPEIENEDAGYVVEIVEDVHPLEFTEGNAATAEFIREDYEQIQEFLPRVSETTFAEEVDEVTTEEGIVLDIKPAGQVSGWDGLPVEATVLGVKPQPAIWTHSDESEAVISVTGVDEDEASVVGIEGEIHPFDESSRGGVRAQLIGDFSSAVSSPAGLPPRSPHVGMAGRNISLASTFASYNPFEDDPSDTPAMSRAGLAALDETESADWRRQPILRGGDVALAILPPQVDQMAFAEVVGDSETLHQIPGAAAATREFSYSSSGGRSNISTDSDTTAMQNGTSARNGSQGSGRGSHRPALNIFSSAASNAARNTTQVMGRFFSDTTASFNRVRGTPGSAADSILPRTLLPWSIFPSETTKMWVATVNTNQKALDNNNIIEASKALRAFSVPSKKQAEALALAWATPKMLPFSDNPDCFSCKVRFAVFRRACHCRNCGVCICSTCATQWPSKMIPETYNIKQKSEINICKSCDWLSSAFRLALLEGNHDEAVALHATGNVNLTTPFANVKGELFYPVHCAILGGNLDLLVWLVDEHCCPLKSIRVSGRSKESNSSFTPILTSRGRSLLGIAMEKESVEIIRYLVVDKGMSLSCEKELSMQRMIVILDQVLRLIPGRSNDTEMGEPWYATTPHIALENMPGVPQLEPTMPQLSSNDHGSAVAAYSNVCSETGEHEEVHESGDNDSTDSVENPVRSLLIVNVARVYAFTCTSPTVFLLSALSAAAIPSIVSLLRVDMKSAASNAVPIFRSARFVPLCVNFYACTGSLLMFSDDANMY